jgi:hypothetical protein
MVTAMRPDPQSRLVRAGQVMLRGITPPAEGGGRRESLRYVRDIQLRVLWLWVPVVIALAFVGATGILIASGVAIVFCVADIVYLTYKIRCAIGHGRPATAARRMKSR